MQGDDDSAAAASGPRAASGRMPRNGFDHVLIVTYGRSGSTLLQGILNAHEDVVILGENNNFLFKLFESVQAIEEARNKAFRVPQDKPDRPWFGIEAFDTGAYVDQLGAGVRSSLFGGYGERIRGFKEIRYPRVLDRLDDYLDFLSAVFPATCFLFNTRDLDAVLSSGWWAKSDTERNRTLLENTEERFRRYRARHPESCYAISYEEVVRGPDALAPMFDFLGLDMDADAVSRTLDVPHSSGGRRKIRARRNRSA